MTKPQPAYGPPPLTELLTRYLAQRSDAASAAVESSGPEVEPYETASGFRTDPRTAWQAATCLLPADQRAAPLPPEWAQLVQWPAPIFAVPCVLGEFPQRLRQLQPLLQPTPLARLLPLTDAPPLPGFHQLRAWIQQQTMPHPIAAALARMLHDWPAAERLLLTDDTNERAAWLWARGRPHDALQLWEHTSERPHILFNRGLARLFLDQPAAALPLLRQAAVLWGTDHPWQPLASLYAAVAEIRLSLS
jgi:hypothetical protein